MPKCKHCGTELEFDDTYDQYCDADIVCLYEVGHCPNCGKEYKWKDYYKFSDYEDLEECE